MFAQAQQMEMAPQEMAFQQQRLEQAQQGDAIKAVLNLLMDPETSGQVNPQVVDQAFGRFGLGGLLNPQAQQGNADLGIQNPTINSGAFADMRRNQGL